ncbi:hypothetical protein CROQUDRAFT_87342 [Cronartium quercuum f. sp. fusiforme G11]|uniref:Uncharacterized protein n=1 Tax=Cronartium quercuum f. sp. fusiforme G11 TaxID=708437 RepID=A0A9P6TFY7_9BASI|nr:hypothetical protein CROQUDRAFT_87342 [Cronartium quercuum f. sp. fusiforme G11]
MLFIHMNFASTIPEQALNHLQTSKELQREISDQMAKIGLAGFTDFETDAKEEALLKLWDCKYKLWIKHIEI